MGMFDTFYFDKDVLPNNKECQNVGFQTKDLCCILEEFKVDKSMSIVSINNYTANDVTAEFEVHSYQYESDGNFNHINPRGQSYEIISVKNKIVYCRKTNEYGYGCDFNQDDPINEWVMEGL